MTPFNIPIIEILMVEVSSTAKIRDKAYVCPGNCFGALTSMGSCRRKHCNLFGHPLQEVTVIYRCPIDRCLESMSPALCKEGCKYYGSRMLAKAVVPYHL